MLPWLEYMLDCRPAEFPTPPHYCTLCVSTHTNLDPTSSYEVPLELKPVTLGRPKEEGETSSTRKEDGMIAVAPGAVFHVSKATTLAIHTSFARILFSVF